MKLNKIHTVFGAALVALSAYAFAAPTAQQGSDNSVVVTGTDASDAQIRDEVAQRINERSELRFDNIGVQSSHHDVYLSGLVDTGSESATAEEIARSVPAVRNVYNGLALNGGGN